MTKKNLERYVESAAELIDLPLLPEHRPGAIANFEKIAEIARLVLEFPLEKELEKEIEAAPKFEP